VRQVEGDLSHAISGCLTDKEEQVRNGGEFINEEVAAYCVREQITFTRGRPYEKQDQCFVEQKNGVVVRQVVGYGQLAGEHAYQQLAELYRALRLYVNCFQPSMKLVAKQVQGRTIHRTYDAAKTPLERLLLWYPLNSTTSRSSIASAKQAKRKRTPFLWVLSRPPESTRILNWRHTCKDPFVGQWEQILALVQADSTLSSGAIFRQLQSQFPGCYQPGHLRTLQRGLRKIRAYVLATREEPQEYEVIQSSSQKQKKICLTAIETECLNCLQSGPAPHNSVMS